MPVTLSRSLHFKMATEPSEFEQIYRLGYDTFVQEIPYYRTGIAGRFVDRFDHENRYAICLYEERLLGMVAVRSTRPFSLDEKLPKLDKWLPQGHNVCEIRLLAVAKSHRSGPVAQGLFRHLFQYCLTQRYTLAAISGILKQQKLYRHLGFVPFGPLVGTADAQFQPMYITLKAIEWRLRS
ncbi:MAG TPA: GNAT family N-acetyltransferase [Nitrospiraceae bacterium]|nr:GNAT family N-acetyltransferase [Nitrospiraceae bacterium]